MGLVVFIESLLLLCDCNVIRIAAGQCRERLIVVGLPSGQSHAEHGVVIVLVDKGTFDPFTVVVEFDFLQLFFIIVFLVHL